MAYASITYTSASGTTFALTNSSGNPIQYLRQADISVTVNGVLKTQGTDYTFNSAGTAIVLTTAVTSATVVISRTTSITDATVSFTAGSTLTAQDLNNSDKQNRFALQEFSDIYGALTTGTGDLSTLGGFIGSAETWLSDNAHAPTTGAVDTRVDSKIDTALTTDVVAGDSITVTDNSPSSGQITIGVTNASISTAKLVDSSVTTAKIADGNVTTAKILDANVTTTKLADSNVTTAKIADNAITSAKIADGTIVAADLASDSVTTAKILDSNVTTGKINDLAVTTAKLADSSVTSAKIVDGTIVAGDLASDSVTTAKIVDSNVTTAKINDSAVTTGKIADSAVTAIKIADGVITSAKLNAATVVTAAEQAACTPDDVTFFTTSASDGRYVNVTGDSMTGALAMGSNKITGLGAPTANADAATKQYVDTSVAAGVGDADYGDITVSGTGTVWTIDSGVVTSAKIADGTIVNGDINAAAAIAGTKISPDFGSQNVTTTGTVTGASLSPTSSTAPTNGVYLPAANTVGISTNGSGRLFVASNGRVGVGQASPTTDFDVAGNMRLHNSASNTNRKLEIRSTQGYSSFIQFTEDNIADRWSLGIANGDGGFIFKTGGDFTGTERLRITSAGLVGVGTSSPSELFNVATSSVSDTTLIRLDGGAGIRQRFFPSGGTGKFNWQIAAQTNVDNGFEITPSSASGGSTFSTPAVVVKSNGNVGIGTSSPASLLHSVGTTILGTGTYPTGSIGLSDARTAILSSTENQILIIGNTNATVGADKGAEIYLGAKATTGSENLAFAKIGGYKSNATSGNFESHLTFNTSNSVGTSSEKVRIDSSGRVGIGTTSPGTRLHVSGTQGDNSTLYITSTDLAANNGGIISIGGAYDGSGNTTAFAQIKALKDNATVGEYGGSLAFFNRVGTGGLNERARIDSSGRLLVGTSSDSSSGRVVIEGSPAASGVQGVLVLKRASNNPASGTQALGAIDFKDLSNGHGASITALSDGSWSTPSDCPTALTFSTTADGASSPTERMRIGNDGYVYIKQMAVGGTANMHWSSTAGQLFVTSSSLRFKKDIVDYDKGLAEVMQMQPKYFVYNQEPGGKQRAGFIAEDFDALGLTEYVEYWKDENDQPMPSEIGYSNMVAILVKAIQELKAEVDDLKSQLA